MRNKIDLPANADAKPFKEYFTKYLNNSLSETICTSLANLLAIDYSERLNCQPDLKNYINDCAVKIKKHIGQKKLGDESFSTIMTLFTVAVTPEKNIDADSEEFLAQSKDALIDAVISTIFPDLAPEELTHFKSLIQNILQESEGKEMMEVITSNPKFFYSLVASTHRTNKKQKDLLRLAHIKLINIVFQNKEKKIDKQPIINELIQKKIESLPKGKKQDIKENTHKISPLSKNSKNKTNGQKELHKKQKDIITDFMISKPKKNIVDKIKEEKSIKKSNKNTRSF